MDVSNLLNSLNDQQLEAVVVPQGNILVLAGAGSGKTRVLVHRIAWLLSMGNYSSCSIMAVTFTNKAAMEIRHRIEHLIGTNSQSGMWIGTFHSLAHRLLRINYIDANLPHSFQIIDKDDQLRLLQRLIRTLNLNNKQWPSLQAMWYINTKKDKGLRPQHIKDYGSPIEATWRRIYQVYQETCDRAGLVDFAELLLRAHEMCVNKPHILHQYRKRFTNILVDEFQDTNRIQYIWIRLIAGNQSNVMIVGDDDQSIYGWRGAQVDNIQHFLDDFPDAQTIRLEQNYRSTSNILRAANILIANNKNRLGKNLWTKGNKGELISLYCALNERDEAHFVAKRIKLWQKQGKELNNCAILYRSNAQSRVLEEVLLQMNLPYCIYGSMRFFERQEIKDALAYLRLITNRNDDAAYERIVNTPTRGIGDCTIDLIRQKARKRHLTLWQASQFLLQERVLTRRIASALQQFINLVDTLTQEIVDLSLHIQIDRVIKSSGLWDMHETGDKSQARIENLQELVNAVQQYNYNNEDHNLSPMQAFLSYAMLGAKEEQVNSYQDAVQMMTLHSAKGLEFSQVFIVGMEEGIFPNKMSLDKRELLDEERRLAYVGVTRAMNKLTITYTETRRLYGQEVFHKPSRFIGELPHDCVEEVCLRANIIHLANYQSIGTLLRINNCSFVLGQRVRHPTFGEGIVVNKEGNGEQCRLQISFQKQGTKWLLATYARLAIL